MSSLLLALVVLSQAASVHPVLAAIDTAPQAATPSGIVVVAPSIPKKRSAGVSGEEWGPIVSARSAVVVDRASGIVLYGKRQYAIRPFASITKLATALTLMSQGDFWSTDVVIRQEDLPPEGNTVFRAGDVVASADLLTAMLVFSDNGAARALVRTGMRDGSTFTSVAQRIALRHGARGVTIRESSGLDMRNRGSAVDAARLLDAAFAYPDLRSRLATPNTHVRINGPQPRLETLRSTNRLLREPSPGSWVVTGGKTGYINESGFNVVVAAEQDGHEIIVVVLGSSTHDDRFRDAAVLIDWTFQNYAWPRRGGAVAERVRMEDTTL